MGLLVRTLERHSSLSDADREAILALPHRVRTLDGSTYLVREGDAPTHCVLLMSGFAYRQKLTGDGARQIIALQIPGDVLDFQGLTLDTADHSVQMLSHGEVAMIPRRQLTDLLRDHPDVARAVMAYVLIEASIFREWILNVGRRDARTRMAHLLCEFASRLRAAGLGDGAGYELPITQEQLADALGLTPVHVNRTLKALETDGLIERNKRFIRFASWEQMREVGDFTQRYLHLEQIRRAPVDPVSAGA